MTTSRCKETISPAARLAILLGLTALCAVQPVLDLVARNAVFLTVHGLDGLQVAALPLLLIGGVAGLLWLPVLAAGCLDRRAGGLLFAALAGLLLAVGLRPLLGRVLPLPGGVQAAAALALAAVVTAYAARRPRLLRHLPALGWAAPLIAAAFLLGPQVRPLLGGGGAGTTARGAPAPDAATPVVVIVFDAFPVASIVGTDGGLDGVLCPNLADFARDASWFPNALGESDDTLWAVPSILTAREPWRGSQPTYRFHPDNLMTWLRPHRPVHSFESHTRLDPAADLPSLAARWQLTLADLAVVAGHVFLPPDAAGSLPPITHDWKGFAGSHDDDDDPRARELLMEGFLTSLETDEPNSCWFLHALVPHTPYSYMPSGRRYAHGGVEPGGQGMQWGRWNEDLQSVVQSQQRHLLQVGFADAYVGRVLRILRERGLYDDAVIVVTADHGVAFRRGDGRRRLTATNAGAILGIPLLIKTPGTGQGRVDPRLARSVDVLPTIAGALGTRLAWAADGVDLMDGTARARPDSLVIVGQVDDLVLALDDIRAQRRAAVERKLRRFGGESGLPGLFAPLRSAAALGAVPAPAAAPADLAAGLEGTAAIVVPDDPAQPLPAEVRGFAASPDAWPAGWDVAVTVDGVVAALTRPRAGDARAGFAAWATLLPEAVLTPGAHTLGVLLVDWRGETPVFHEAGACGLDLAGADLLQADLPGLVRAGLHGSADWAGRPARWTDGRGVISLATTGTTTIAALEVEVLGAAPAGGDLLVTANGVPLATIPLGRDPWRGILDLRGIDPADGLILEFHSPASVPARDVPGATDTRRLGVALGRVALLAPGDVDGELLPRPAAVALHPHDPGPWALGGFYRAEPWGADMAAWTDSLAEARMEPPAPARPRFLLVDLAATGPRGARLSVDLDGEEVLAADLPAGPWSGCAPIPAGSPAPVFDVRLATTTFVPAAEDPASTDRRHLGVALRRLVLVF